MSFPKYKRVIQRDPGAGLDSVAEALGVGSLQVLSWAARHVSEDGLRNPGSPSRDASPSHRIVAESSEKPGSGSFRPTER